MKQTMLERRETVRRAQAQWAEGRNARREVKLTSFDIISLASGATIGYADDKEHVIEMADDYRQNPDIAFVGIDEDGRETGSWTLTEVLNGTFEEELSA